MCLRSIDYEHRTCTSTCISFQEKWKTKKEQWGNIKFLVKFRKTAVEAYDMLLEAFLDTCMLFVKKIKSLLQFLLSQYWKVTRERMFPQLHCNVASQYFSNVVARTLQTGVAAHSYWSCCNMLMILSQAKENFLIFNLMSYFWKLESRKHRNRIWKKHWYSL